MMNGLLLVFSTIIHDNNNTVFSDGNGACVWMRHRGKARVLIMETAL